MTTSNFKNWKVRAGRFTPWNEVTESATITEKEWRDTHAGVLAILLGVFPQEPDNKQRMERLIEAADAITESFYK